MSTPLDLDAIEARWPWPPPYPNQASADVQALIAALRKAEAARCGQGAPGCVLTTLVHAVDFAVEYDDSVFTDDPAPSSPDRHAPEEGRCVCTPGFCVGVPGDSDTCKVCLALDPEVGCALDRHAPEEGRCRAHRDGECHWTACPQSRDGEPKASGRHCPIDTAPEETT